MNSSHLKVLTAICLCLISVNTYAQRIVTGKGTYTYPIPENISIEDAKTIVLEKARLQVIADEFGTIVDMTTVTEVANSNGNSSVEMMSFGESEVKGEWIEDIAAPEFKIDYNHGCLSITVTVEGKIREIVCADIDFSAKVLRNGVEDRFEGCDFRHGDDLYMSFQSPIDGYLAVYLYTGEDDAYCLLPYIGQTEGYFNVKRNKKYILFSADNASEGLSSAVVDEYNMTASRSKEINLIYIMFSPNKFVKALDNDSDGVLPRSLDYKSFQKWLIKCRNRDKEMRVQRKTITISK